MGDGSLLARRSNAWAPYRYLATLWFDVASNARRDAARRNLALCIAEAASHKHTCTERMALNPIAYTENVVRSFLRYQLTAYPFADPGLHAQMRDLLSLDHTRQSPLLARISHQAACRRQKALGFH